jgi:ribosomal protein S18 acetylase RimI-like enzyme
VEYLKEQGLKRLWVGLDTRNESARRFYLKLGFRDILASPPGNMGLDFVDLK